MKKIMIMVLALISLLSAQTVPGRVWSQYQLNESNSGFGLPASSFFGSSIANIGDFDNDGIEDFAVGAEGYNNAGACWLVTMNANYTVKSKVMISSALALTAGDNFGSSLTGIGDFNNDGIKDIAVGAPGDDSGGNSYGALYLLYLNADGTLKYYSKLTSSTTGFAIGDFTVNGNFGSSVAFLGDYNNDTYKEIAIGATGTDSFSGAVWLLSLKNDGAVQAKSKIGKASISNLASYDTFGASIAQIGDLDGDNIKDLVVGAPLSEDDTDKGTGAVYLIRMNSNLTVKSYTIISVNNDLLNNKLANYDQFGSAVCVPGDIDKNGYLDLIAGAYQSDDGTNAAGAVWVLLLGADGAVEKVQKISSLQGDLGFAIPTGTQFGSSLAVLADVDNNGVPGFVTGMQNFNANAVNQGAIDIINLHGNATTDSTSLNDGVAITTWGTVNPYGIPTTVTFEYGTSTAYGSVSSPVVINGSSDQLVNVKLTGLQLNTDYHFRVKMSNSRGFTYGRDKSFKTAGVSSLSGDILPALTELFDCYPNPFNPETTIKFALANQGKVALTVYNAKGEMVDELVNEVRNAGYHSVKFNAATMNSGVYFYKLTTPEKAVTQKMLLVK